MYMASEILQILKDKKKAISMRLKMSFVVFVRALLIVIMVTLIYQNASFVQFEMFSEDIKMKGMVQKNITSRGPNATINVRQNITHEKVGVKDEIDAKFKKFIGSKNILLTNSTNNSTPTSSKGIIDDNEEKLLDGLLVSGFDQASCISRLQSHFYHKSSPHKPSPYLISKLRKYEEIHRKCGPNTRAYNRDMEIIVNSKNNNDSSRALTTCKYIIWVPAYGLGNQIISIVSSFLYALLTDRVMLVKFGKDKEGLFCEPFLNSTWLLPEKSPFWNARNVQSYQRTIDMELSNTLNEDLPLALHVDLRYSPSHDERFFHCDHSQFLLSKIPLLFLEAGQYFVPSFFMTPIFQKELNKMFPEITSIFHHLVRYLFHPSNEAWKLITSFYQQHLAKANEIIGLQIRVLNTESTPHELFMNRILNCTLENKLLPNVLDTKNTSMSSNGKNKTIIKAILVASLYSQYSENLKMMYMNKSTVTGEIIEVYQPSSEKKQIFDDNKHNLKAWVDMYLLSLSDELVTTYQSTFGYVAKGLGNSKPWILYNPAHDIEICEREFTLEPCYHSPPRHYCDSGDVIEDVASSFPNIRRCKDFRYGWKLVNSSA
ncbi:probable fucosyltransferase 7 [Vicia villosa]|uniref:probable fucosyltransferase 7 n=1 Tax=Vicia villosa TaxID=3911 RepID=UPI00273BBF0C|nr:probable fucosyltransferase 7 [Vicia villosa]